MDDSQGASGAHVAERAVCVRDYQEALAQAGCQFTRTFRADGNAYREGALESHRQARRLRPRDFTIACGLMSYGGSFVQSHRQAGIYTGRIVMGAKPADLPVREVTKIEFLINLRTAKSLGVTFPRSLLVLADEVIE